MDRAGMTVTIPTFLAMLEDHGSDVVYHSESGGTECPCRTREGNRDPAWHLEHPAEPVCNELGMLPVEVEFSVKASVQPMTGGIRRRDSERISAMFPGEVKADDHLGIFPCEWNGHTLDFGAFSDTGEDYIVYNGRRFVVVSSDKLPDVDGDPNHHWELGLRLSTTVRVNA